MYISKQQIALVLGILLLASLSVYLYNKAPVAKEVTVINTDSTTSTPMLTVDESTSSEKSTEALSHIVVETNLHPSAIIGKMAPEFVRPGAFSNTGPFLLRDLRGKKIVLVEFWATSKIESTHTIPYLNDWYAKYHNFGLTIVAIHTPRFVFERSKVAVDQFAYAHNMSYPIVVDNGAETWTAYKNTIWPHLYLIDLDGRIVYEHQGDSAYQATEVKLLTLLNGRAVKLKLPVPPDQKLSQLNSENLDVSQIKSTEAFFGASRNQNLANGVSRKEGVQTFNTLTEPKLNMIYLFGSWNIKGEYAESMTEHSSLLYKYHAKRVYAVLGAQKILRVRVLLDGKAIDTSLSGSDIRFEKGDSVFYVDHERLYDIVNAADGYADHTIELVPDSGGINAYTLTFK